MLDLYIYLSILHNSHLCEVIEMLGVQERALDYRKIIDSLAKGSHPEEHSEGKFRASVLLNF